MSAVERAAGGGEWQAAMDFDLKNLRCKAGERLPPRWQSRDLVKYLRKTHGDGCVRFVEPAHRRPAGKPKTPEGPRKRGK